MYRHTSGHDLNREALFEQLARRGLRWRHVWRAEVLVLVHRLGLRFAGGVAGPLREDIPLLGVQSSPATNAVTQACRQPATALSPRFNPYHPGASRSIPEHPRPSPSSPIIPSELEILLSTNDFVVNFI